MIDKLDPTFRFYQEAANLRAHRQQLIASNIANADTPKYKARDISFKDALSNVVARTIFQHQAERLPARPCYTVPRSRAAWMATPWIWTWSVANSRTTRFTMRRILPSSTSRSG
jgi:flagellar basal-body rod protein FlgB